MNAPTSTHNQPEYSVSELAGALKRTVEEKFGYVRVRGEISGLKRAASGHCYFDIKDEKAVLNSVCWKGVAARLAVQPEQGMEVIATGKISTYPGRSNYQMVVESLEPAGVGALMAMLEKRKQQLAAEGLFEPERKQRLPQFPQHIGVITSPTGAVIRDILHRISERYPVRVTVWPVRVQGEGAAEEIAAAIEGFNADAEALGGKPDLLIVARGGGSLEDLWAFNEEVVVRAAAASQIPLISAVGHETDTTLIDYASDQRAPTPTGAAEMAVPVRLEWLAGVEELRGRMTRLLNDRVRFAQTRLEGVQRGFPSSQRLLADPLQRLDRAEERLHRALPGWVQAKQHHLQQLGMTLAHHAPHHRIERAAELLAWLQERAKDRLTRLCERAEQQLAMQGAQLKQLDYRNVLKRGFAMAVASDGALIDSAGAAQTHGSMTLRFHDGELAVHQGEGTTQPAPPPKAIPTKKPKPKKKAAPKVDEDQLGMFD